MRIIIGPFFVAMIAWQTTSAMAASGEVADRRKSAAQLTIPANFQGGLFICDPYCEAIAVRRGQKWNPPLESIFIKSTKMKLMPTTDPLFPRLFPAPVVAEKPAEEPKPEPPIAETPKLTDTKPEPSPPVPDEGPAPPKVAFANGFRVPIFIDYDLLRFTSDSNVEGNFNGNGSSFSLQLEGDYYRAKPLRLLRQWWQFEAGYLVSVKNNQFRLLSGDNATLKETAQHLYIWDKFEKFSLSLRFSTRSFVVSTPVNMLKEYAFNEKWNLVGLGLKLGRWDFFYDHALLLGLQEQQTYRDHLNNFSGENFGVRYCFREFMGWRGVGLNSCVMLSRSISKTSSALNPNLGNLGELNFNRDLTRAVVQINFGDDFNL